MAIRYRRVISRCDNLSMCCPALEEPNKVRTILETDVRKTGCIEFHDRVRRKSATRARIGVKNQHALSMYVHYAKQCYANNTAKCIDRHRFFPTLGKVHATLDMASFSVSGETLVCQYCKVQAVSSCTDCCPRCRIWSVRAGYRGTMIKRSS